MAQLHKKARSSDNKKLNETFLKVEGGPIRQQLNMLTPPSRLIFICYFGTSLENTGIFNFQVIATNVLMGICRYCFWWVRFNYVQPMLRLGPRGPKGQEMGTNLCNIEIYL